MPDLSTQVQYTIIGLDAQKEELYRQSTLGGEEVEGVKLANTGPALRTLHKQSRGEGTLKTILTAMSRSDTLYRPVEEADV